MNFNMKILFSIITSHLLIKQQNGQYNIVRINPLQQLSESLKTHHEKECEDSVMSLQCPEGTKVRISLLVFLIKCIF